MNKKRMIWIVIGGVFLLILILGGFLIIGGDWGVEEIKCVAASCCHSTSCVLESEAPNCSNIGCTMSCEPGTLDCGQARCEYVDKSCEVVLNE